MTTIWYENIEDILLNMADPNTWAAISEVPGVSSPKINAGVSVYNVEAEWWLGIAWWSTDVKWTAWVWSISWSSGNINLPDWTQISISSGSASVSSNTYIYVDTQTWTVSSTNSAIDAVWENKIMICAAFPNSWKNVTFKAFWCADQNSLATWADIAAWTIVASNIASNTITASQIASWTITANEIAGNTITASEIASWAITASKIDVNQLSAISANLGTITAWDISWTTLTAWSTSGWAVKIYPYSSSRGRIDFYYNGSVVGYIRWANASGVWNVLFLSWDYVYSSWRMYCGGKLRIPVWVNLYW